MNNDFYESEQAQILAEAYQVRARKAQCANFNPLAIILVAMLFNIL
jgi:hypothetical protein